MLQRRRIARQSYKRCFRTTVATLCMQFPQAHTERCDGCHVGVLQPITLMQIEKSYPTQQQRVQRADTNIAERKLNVLQSRAFRNHFLQRIRLQIEIKELQSLDPATISQQLLYFAPPWTKFFYSFLIASILQPVEQPIVHRTLT